MELKERVLGCMVGGACGDALGYGVEFLRLREIKEKYGRDGITELLESPAKISDDTQMSLFTANGLLYGYTMAINRGVMGEYKDYIWLAYKDWLLTQIDQPIEKKHAWIFNLKELHNSRGPGATCIEAIATSDKGGTIENHINTSKGCGGVMRVAPVGLFLNPDYIYHEAPEEYVCKVGAEVAALTHGHPLGYITAGFLCVLINRITYPQFYGEAGLEDNVRKSMKTTCNVFSNDEYSGVFSSIMEHAIELAKGNLSDEDAVFTMGEGWTAEEAIGIATICALRHEKDFKKALICAANHDGDSDSTASITGNILGAHLGIAAVRKAFDVEKLEIRDAIETLAEDLAYAATQSDYDADFESDDWAKKYIFVNYLEKNG